MLRRFGEIKGYDIAAEDTDVGKVKDLYFELDKWDVRHIVVDTGKWLPGRKVLIPPMLAGNPDKDKEEVPVYLTKEEVEESPPIERDKPVSKQYDLNLYQYFGGISRRKPGRMTDTTAVPHKSRDEQGTAGHRSEQKMPSDTATEKHTGDWTLRSANEIIDYHLMATDGGVGRIEDFLVDDEWNVRYLVANTGHILPGKKVLLSPNWIEDVDMAEKGVTVKLSSEMIRQSPEYDPSSKIEREYEEKLFEHYGEAKYWV